MTNNSHSEPLLLDRHFDYQSRSTKITSTPEEEDEPPEAGEKEQDGDGGGHHGYQDRERGRDLGLRAHAIHVEADAFPELIRV